MAYSSGDTQLLKEGYLLKAPDSSKRLTSKWPRKWFRLLENGDLHYFDTEKASKPVGTIRLLQCYRLFDGKVKGQLCMGLEVEHNTYYLKAESASVYNEWLDLIAAFAEVNDAKPATPSASPLPSRRHTATASSERRGSDFRRGSDLSTRSSVSPAKGKLGEKKGWLYKTGPNNKGWNRRYFILSGGKLSYYKTDKAESASGSIDLRECTGVSQAAFKKGFGFSVQVPSRTYSITADTQLEQEEWIAAISSAVSLFLDGKAPVDLHVPSSLVRSGSGSSQSSTASRDLLSVSMGEGQTTGQDKGSAQEDGEEKKVEKDSVIQLLEAEVDALRGQVSGLQEELQSSSSVTAHLQEQLAESGRRREREVHRLTVERNNLHTKLSELEGTKTELERVNDSLRVQLEENSEKIQEVEEEGAGLRQELDETQSALTSAEEEVKVYQQELAETQQHLQEIQEVAQQLQSELTKRGETTPSLTRKGITEQALLSSLDFTTPILSKDSKERADSSQERDSEGGGGLGTSREVEGDGSVLAGERLKWQMEMENLRKEYEQRLQVVVETHRAERAGLEERVGEMAEKCRVLDEEVKDGRRSRGELKQAQERVRVLKGEVSGVQEKAAQLQVEKEKALSDLNNIRKINRTMEKRLSEGETAVWGAQPTSPPGDSDLQLRLEESEQRVEQLNNQLEEVQQERDNLRAQLENLVLANGGTAGVNMSGMSPFGLRRKTRATVAVSNQSHTAPTTSVRAGSFSNMATSLTNGLPPSGAAPPKPERPPKGLISSKMMATQQQEHSRPVSWSSAMFQSLFRGHR